MGLIKGDARSLDYSSCFRGGLVCSTPYGNTSHEEGGPQRKPACTGTPSQRTARGIKVQGSSTSIAASIGRMAPAAHMSYLV